MSEMTLEELNDLAANIREMKAIAPYTTSIEGAILLACARIAEQDAEIERLKANLDEMFLMFEEARKDSQRLAVVYSYNGDMVSEDRQDAKCKRLADFAAAYLRERNAVSSTDTRPPTHGVQSGVQKPEEGGQNA